MAAALKQVNQLKIKLTVVKGPHVGAVFNFDKPILSFGRGPENDVVLINDPMVSRSHAKLELIKNQFELANLSEKNILLVHGESVQRSVLVNDSTFQIGDSELKLQFDLGQAVVSVSPIQQISTLLKLVPAKGPRGAANSVESRNSLTKSNPGPLSTRPPSTPSAPQTKIKPVSHQFNAIPISASESGKKILFYAVAGIILLAAVWFVMSAGKGKSAKAKPLLKYEDEVAISLNSKPENELRKKREEDRKTKESPTALRAEENFIKGMRDYQLRNYARAQDFFQVVLNLIPDHPLARRHLYLSKVRFDESVQTKLVLGESYYQKHNFNMCVAMYQQVMNMLQNKSSDQKYQLAQRMAEKCQFAAEGIQ